MFDGMSFDDINKLHSAEHKNISLPYDQYFGEMTLTEAQIERRIETAKSLEDVFLFIASLMFYMVQADIMDYSTVYDEAASRYQSVIKQNNIENTAFFNEYHVPGAVSEIVNTTIQNPDRTFNYSYDRVMLIAENEANAIWNDAEFQEAIDSGKTNKRWLSIIDKRTRDSHRYLDGKTKPIMEPFEVGEYLMMFPKDESFGAGMEEIANCRCGVEYFGKTNTSEGLSDITDEYKIVPVEIEQSETDAEKANAFREQLSRGDVDLSIRAQKQNEHIDGTRERERRVVRDAEQGRTPSSVFVKNLDLRYLLSLTAGKGNIFYKKNHPYPMEYVTVDKPIGMVYNQGTGNYDQTRRFVIMYSSKGVHMFPVKELI